MNELDEAILTRRAEKMLYDAGLAANAVLTVLVVEKVWRESMPFDRKPWIPTYVEQEGLYAMREHFSQIEP